MTRVYVDVEAAAIESSGVDPSLDPAAVRSLRFLAEAGNEVILVASSDTAVPAELRDAARSVVAEVPGRPPDQAWYLTSDVERCTGTSAKLRTVLVGAAPPSGSIHRCDGVARDLQAAALELLAREAMPPR
ncbi:MAG TPA: hypothetical protein VGI98_01330 [Candidatus Limnocylindrales bacterium]